MAKTRAQTNREIRQEALRDQLKAKGLVQQALESIKKMEELQVIIDSDDGAIAGQFELQKLKAANEHRLKLINKVFPDLKAVEWQGDLEVEGNINHTVDPETARQLNRELEEDY